jgi:hypothetical protein
LPARQRHWWPSLQARTIACRLNGSSRTRATAGRACCGQGWSGFHQDVVIDPIEELLQIHIDHHPVTVLHVALCIEHRVVRTASRTKAVAVFGERRINDALQDLQQGLLDQPIHHRRNPQFAHAAIGLRDLDAAHRQRPVAAIEQGFPNPGPVRSQVVRRLGNRQPIRPSTAAIGFDAFPRRLHVRFRERLRKQAISPQASSFMPRRPCFITHRFRLGFTSPSRVAPRFPRLLMHCTSERHGLRPSYSFGPSPRHRQLLWPLLTSRSGFHRRPFRHEARSPQVRTRSFPAQPPRFTPLRLDHKSFAECCPLALLGSASYPVLVHRLAVSLHASFPHSVALMQLRFTSFAVISLRKDFHLQDRAHAGRTGLWAGGGKRAAFSTGRPQDCAQRKGGNRRSRLSTNPQRPWFRARRCSQFYPCIFPNHEYV